MLAMTRLRCPRNLGGVRRAGRGKGGPGDRRPDGRRPGPRRTGPPPLPAAQERLRLEARGRGRPHVLRHVGAAPGRPVAA